MIFELASKYKIDVVDADLDHFKGTNSGLNNGRTSDLFAMVDHILEQHSELHFDFNAFQQKVIRMPEMYRNSVDHTFSSSSMTFVLGSST